MLIRTFYELDSIASRHETNYYYQKKDSGNHIITSIRKEYMKANICQ